MDAQDKTTPLVLQSTGWSATGSVRHWYLQDKPIFKGTIWATGNRFFARLALQPNKRKPRRNEWTVERQGSFETFEEAKDQVERWCRELLESLESKRLDEGSA